MQKQPDIFRFKQFEVRHNQSTMKVGTDAVLLGAWVQIAPKANVLEIGTGCGVISLMIAQRFEKITIKSIDIDINSIQEANQNFHASQWFDRLEAENVDFNAMESLLHFDHIISNPPYFTAGTTSAELKRGNARHTQALNYDQLISKTYKLLTEHGKLSVIIPATEKAHFEDLANESSFFLEQELAFKPRVTATVERYLMTFCKHEGRKKTAELIHYDGVQWTEDYKALTREFYLKL